MAKHDAQSLTDRGPATLGGRETPPPALAGSLLRAGREAAGLTIDAVAQQLKLAPRQVQALEEGDYTRLPGRTFVRGFMRNYARLVHIDPESVLRALPAGSGTPSLDTPMLQATAPTMGELPVSERPKPGSARWIIPVTLAAIVAAAALYEWLRPASDLRSAVLRSGANGAEHPVPVPKPEAAGTVLPNPLATPAPPDTGSTSAPAAASAPGAAMPVTSVAPSPTATASSPAPAATPNPGVAPRSASPQGRADAPATGSAATGVSASASTPEAAATDQPLVLAFRDYSWTEVRDRHGRVLLSGFHSSGTSQTLSGAPPLDIVIGNASEVSVRYKGQPVDLVPYTRQNVARFTLP